MREGVSSVAEVLASKDHLGETPLWCEKTGKLWWIDIEKPSVQCLHSETGKHSVFHIDSNYVGSLALTDTNCLLIATDLTLALFDPRSGRVQPIAQVDDGLDNRINDGRADAKGRFWTGTLDNQLSRPNGSIYRLETDGTVTKLLDDVIVTNGIVHSPDGRTFYFTDTRRFTTWAFDIDPDDGAITNRRVFADHTAARERPDGACIDVDGCIWQAFFSGSQIVRYQPNGTIDRRIELPVTNPTCVCFGGKELRTLYVTSGCKFLSQQQLDNEPMAGSLFAIEGLGQGLPEHRVSVTGYAGSLISDFPES
ncbi:MAG: SMP-30/gluconolactonase/LRE family protein [Hyphomicrobiaceae bacterium]